VVQRTGDFIRSALSVYGLAAILASCSASNGAIPQSSAGSGPASSLAGQSRSAQRPLETGHGFKVIYFFRGQSDGSEPESGVTFDSQGALYGTTNGGGAYDLCNGYRHDGCGTVFKLTPSASGYTESVLYSFDGHRAGGLPWSGVTLDSNGTLYGAAPGSNGIRGCATIFKLTGSGSKYSEHRVVRVGARIGCNPEATMVLGKDDALYGTTWLGGRTYEGTVFKIELSGARPIAKLLREFKFGKLADGLAPFAGVTLDAHGNIYGTTTAGGSPAHCGNYYVGCGTVFKLTPSGSRYKESVIHSFVGTDGDAPYGGLILDKSGAIYGTTAQGGTAPGFRGNGTVFKLTPSGSGYAETVLYKFLGSNHRDGQWPESGLVLGKDGALYGTTYWGGISSCSCGTVFKLTPSGSSYTESVLHRFSGPDGCEPRAGLTERNGVLYGTTSSCGAAQNYPWTVFQITP
jgi:uncharacterized repeat protein (TIGR03803 family)